MFKPIDMIALLSNTILSTYSKHRIARVLGGLIFIWCSTILANADITIESNDNKALNKLKSAYLFNFLKYVDIPQPSKAIDSPWQVCILGLDPFGEALSGMKGKSAKGKLIEVKQTIDVDKTQQCDLVYISQSKSLEIEPVMDNLRERKILTVSEIENFTQLGGIIQFVGAQESIGLEINLKQAKLSGIKISALLLEIAKVIE